MRCPDSSGDLFRLEDEEGVNGSQFLVHGSWLSDQSRPMTEPTRKAIPVSYLLAAFE
jgi:hypothetical protein